MSRFSQPPDRVFSALDSSIGYDWRLGPYDVEQSRAHAKMLAATGIISEADRDALLAGPAARRGASSRTGEFPFEPGDVDIHMAIERRLTEIAGPVGGKLHTARSRNDQVATDMAMFTRAHALTTLERLQQLQSVLVQLADAHLDWPMPGYTHLQRAQPVYLSHHLLAYFWMFRRDARRFEFVLGSHDRAAARRRRAGGRELRHRPRPAGGRARLRGGGARTRSTPSPTATSCSTSCPPRRPARRTCRGSAPRSCCGRARSSASARSPTRGRRAPRSCRRRRTPTPPSCCAPRRRAWSRT